MKEIGNRKDREERRLYLGAAFTPEETPDKQEIAEDYPN